MPSLNILGNGSKVTWGLSNVRRNLPSLKTWGFGDELSSWQPRNNGTEVAGVFRLVCVYFVSEWVSFLVYLWKSKCCYILALPSISAPTLSSSTMFMKVLKKEAYFHSMRQTSLERQRNMTLGWVAGLEDKEIQVLHPAVGGHIAVTLTRWHDFLVPVFTCHLRWAGARGLILKILSGSHSLLSATRKSYASPRPMHIVLWMCQNQDAQTWC